MKSVFLIIIGRRPLFVALLAVLFVAGCCKHEDDCPAPEKNDPQTTSRAHHAGQNDDAVGDRPAGVTYRGAEAGEGDTDGSGISDDGDDEADGEGNKKNRPSH